MVGLIHTWTKLRKKIGNCLLFINRWIKWIIFFGLSETYNSNGISCKVLLHLCVAFYVCYNYHNTVLTSAFLCPFTPLPDVSFLHCHHRPLFITPPSHELPPVTIQLNHQERLTWTLKSWAESRHGDARSKASIIICRKMKWNVERNCHCSWYRRIFNPPDLTTNQTDTAGI